MGLSFADRANIHIRDLVTERDSIMKLRGYRQLEMLVGAAILGLGARR